ncbi:hypothetical protein SteCoe_9681 [Stentor coeruleus]|uniref:Uncharacterized protein n=1 Tax=Stentor coeruleus TaxID=5963 RepID=A0A1R2CHD1_9CILI|nr:hypothetical protein SteCoe_9681 [Stentor coeruleus]
MNDKEIDVEILSIVHNSTKGDILCYIYADNNLLDAVTLTEDVYEPAITTLPSYPDQVIQIIAKDLLRSQPIGTVQFNLGLLLESSEPVILPMNSTLIEFIPVEISKPYIQLKWYSKDIVPKHSENFLDKTEDNDVYKAMQSELEIEKWKNKGLKQLREEMNMSEMARVTAVQKLQTVVEEYEKEISSLKKQIGFNPYEQILTQQKQVEEEFFSAVNEWKNKEKEYIENITLLEEEKYQQDLEISKLKAENHLSKLELETTKNLLKVEKLKKEQTTQEELALKIKVLEENIEEKQRELEINKKITNEALEQLSHFQVHNTFLRSHIEAIEEKLQEFIKESPPDIARLVQHHLDALDMPVKSTQVTENIFKIENETLHLYFDKNELMAQQGGKTTTFIDWVQKFKWKNKATHKRSKSEDAKVPQKELSTPIEAKLDIVPEVEIEHEEEPQKKSTTPVKTAPSIKILKKSPSGKIIRNYSPILSKKKTTKTLAQLPRNN